ncbi:hypothetical protein J0A65_08325 [Bowmanella sp. Y57]|uniref:Transposase n=1 Tax=Bowmanella yangjiangensis TaxID=2811230 RepID=A0ABS3CTN4_9ALTE|nr:hypothetical protein [Bowmanella yangjiangensis]
MSDFNYFYGIDLAKLSFSIHGQDRHGKPLIHKTVSRTKLLKKMANLPVGLVGLEACCAAHYWAMELKKLGRRSIRSFAWLFLFELLRKPPC